MARRDHPTAISGIAGKPKSSKLDIDSPKSPESLLQGVKGIIAGFVVPGLPHPLLVPDANPAYRKIRAAYAAVRKEIEALDPDLILLYSTQWLSVIGHQVQARAAPQWRHVDPEWHELGTIPYKLRMDPAFGAAYVQHGQSRGLEMRTVDYHGFPIDTGTVVALQLLNPDNRFSASVVSCNMYADRAETIVLGKAARDAATAQGKRVVAIAVTALSNRMHTDARPFVEDRIHSLKDDEWNRKYLEILGNGRLEAASQLAREFSTQASGDQKMKAIWWLAATLGQSNGYHGRVFEYQPLYGTGAALVGLWPSAKAGSDVEFDEDDAESYRGDRNVLDRTGKGATKVSSLTMEEQDNWEPAAPVNRGGTPLVEASPDWTDLPDAAERLPHGNAASKASTTGAQARPASSGVVETVRAPTPLAAYAHARRVGDTIYVAGIGPRDPNSNATIGGPVYDKDHKPLKYDVKAQTEQVLRNIQTILAESGCTMEDVFDVSAFLIDMKNDFAGFNEVYNKWFGAIKPARTTVQVEALPGPIAVELKVLAKART